MTIKETLEKIKKIQADILKFIEDQDDIEENFQNLRKKIEEHSISENRYNLTLFFHLIANIAENHFHEKQFYDKIEKIILLFKKEIKEQYTDSDIFNIFKNNKKVLLFLLEEQLMSINNYIATQMQSDKYEKRKYPQFFFPEIKPFLKTKKEKKGMPDNQLLNIVENLDKNDSFAGFMILSSILKKRGEQKKKEDKNDWISQFSKSLPQNFYENRKIGENESDICNLIRKDKIDDFITYVERENYPIESKVEPSLYETNPFLLKSNKITLIEYASFFGSVQIFKYLFKNGVKLSSSIWSYAVHSNNPELIHLLEDSNVRPNSYSKIFNEAIQCHHNSIATYISNNYSDQENKEEEKNDENEEDEEEEKKNEEKEKDSFTVSLKSYNFEFIQEDSINTKSFYNLCKYDYCVFVEYLLKQKEDVDVNEIKTKTVEYGYEDEEEFTEETSILHSVIKKGNVNIIKLLFSNENLDVNSTKKFIRKKPKRTKEGNFLMDSYLGTEFDSWYDWTDDDYDIVTKMTPLNYAIDIENNEMVKLLLSNKKIDINLFSEYSMESPEENYSLVSPLLFAIKKENLEIIKFLLQDENIDPNLVNVSLSNNPDGNGKHIQRRERTALHLAIEDENVEIVKLLLMNDKIDVNISRVYFKYSDEHEEWSSDINEQEKNALHLAIYKENVEIVKLLLSNNKIDVNMPQKSLKSDIWIDDADEWDDRRAPEENPTFKDSYLWADIPNKLIHTLREKKSEKSPLIYAVENKNVKIVELLLHNVNIDVNLRSNFTNTEFVAEDKINKNNVEEKTALNIAIEKGDVGIVNLLLRNPKIDINLPSKVSTMPRESPKAKGKSKKDKNETKNVQAEVKETTPLQIATEKGNKQIIELLRNHK